MKTKFLCLLWMGLFVPMAANAAPIQLSKTTRVEVVESFTARELWNTAKPNVVAGTISTVIESRLFDPESQPRSGKWYGCAMLMVGTEDLGIQPVAIRIWTVKPCDLKINAKVNSARGADFDVRINTNEVFNVHVSEDLRVSIGGKAIGYIKD